MCVCVCVYIYDVSIMPVCFFRNFFIACLEGFHDLKACIMGKNLKVIIVIAVTKCYCTCSYHFACAYFVYSNSDW